MIVCAVWKSDTWVHSFTIKDCMWEVWNNMWLHVCHSLFGNWPANKLSTSSAGPCVTREELAVDNEMLLVWRLSEYGAKKQHSIMRQRLHVWLIFSVKFLWMQSSSSTERYIRYDAFALYWLERSLPIIMAHATLIGMLKTFYTGSVKIFHSGLQRCKP